MRRVLLLLLILACAGVLTSSAQPLVTQPTPLRNAAADGATKGVAAFTAADFNSTAGVISLDYANGTAASGSSKGFLTSADWVTFNGKQATITAGAGLSFSGSTLATASTEADFLASGALTCGAGTQGKAQIHTSALQYCDNAGTPTLRYAAYGDSAGKATIAVIADTVTTNANLTGPITSVGNGTTITRSCQPGYGDGLNAIASGTYVPYGCRNAFAGTWTLTRVACKADAAGITAVDVKIGAGTSILTGTITCGNGSFTAGTLKSDGTQLIAADDVVDFTFVSNGTPKKVHLEITGTF